MIYTFKGSLGVTNRRVYVAKPLIEISKSQVWVLVLQRPRKEVIRGFGVIIGS